MRRVLSALVACGVVVAVAPSAHAVAPIRPAQWYLDNWKIDEAWRISQGEGLTVAVVDTGVDSGHPDLAGQVVATPFGAGDTVGHGTSMASDIAGTGRGVGGQGAYGVAPKAKIISYQVNFDGSNLTDLNKVVPAVRGAADSPARIITLAHDGPENRDLSEAIAYALSRGKLVIAPGSNVDPPGPVPPFPAANPGVLGVGGYDRQGKAWDRGVHGNWISLAAPSVDVVSACTGTTGYCRGVGTSHATALTAGVAALLWAKYPHYTANQIIKILIDSANKPSSGLVPSDSLGWGNISPRQALNWTGDPGPPDVNPLVGKRGVKPSPSPSVAAPSNASSSAVPSPTPFPAVGSPTSDKDGSDNTLLLTGVIVAAVLIVGTGAAAFTRSRLRRRP